MKDSKIPKKTAGDVAHALVKAGISEIPILGAPASELLRFVVAPPYEKRRDEWFESIGNGIKELTEKIEGFKIEELSNNETFITTVTHASEAAIRNHQKEKLEALRNAVLNAALPNALEENLQLMFLNFVDSFTPWHLVLLEFFNNPREWGNKHEIKYPEYTMGGHTSTIIELTFQDFKDKSKIYDLLTKELYSRGLLSGDSLHTYTTEPGMFASRTTTLGKQFLSFIKSPLEDEY